MIHRALVLGLLVAPLQALCAQDTTIISVPPASKPAADSLPCTFCHRASVPGAIAEGFLINGLVNRLNAWVLNDAEFKVSPGSWRTNLRRGFAFDRDDFQVNMLGHPYNGSLYYAAARANGLSYWAGAPLTFFHSMVWEYFGETTQASTNDLIDTGMGGTALGEMFHRVAATIRDNEQGGVGRTLHEIAAIPFDPVGSVNRLVRGEWSRKGPNPSEHNPVGTVVRLGGGVGLVRAPGSLTTSLKNAEFTSILFADLKYGDSYTDTLHKPFDAFSARLLLAPSHGTLEQLVGVGRITGKEIGRGDWHRQQLEVNQRFEYINNGALQFGAQTLQLGVSSRIHIAGKFWLRTLAAADGIVLSAINAPGGPIRERDYDYGPGIGSTLSAGIEHSGTTYLQFQYQPAYIHTLTGAGADHRTAFGSLELNLPVTANMTFTVHSTYFDRVSKYADGSSNRRSFPEVRIFLAYKSAHKAISAN